MAETFETNFNKRGARPTIGITTDPFSSPIYEYDKNGKIIGARGNGMSAISQVANGYSDNPEDARIGDYYYDKNGNLNVVPNSPTDIFNKWKLTNDVIGPKPELGDIVATMLSPIIPSAATGGVAAFTGAKAAKKAALAGASAVGASGTATMAGLPLLAIHGVVSANAASAQEKAYHDALKEWQKAQDRANWKLAGNITIDEKGNAYFSPDPSKAISMNTAFAGSEIQKAFQKETDVHFGDDGRLKINVNPIYAASDDYKERLDKIKQAYAGLTKDTDGVDDYLEEIRKYIDDGNNQFKFSETSKFSYKSSLPNASDDVIDDVYTNEIGAYISESDGGKYNVKVYRDGKIEEKTAKEVLENVYDMDKGKRSDYMLDLYSKMDDPNISDDDKAYILSEIKLLQAASENDKTYDNGQKDGDGNSIKTQNKYFKMIDQESIISYLNNYNIIGGISITDAINFLDGITPWNMHISKQEGLKEDPAAASSARLISSATSAVTSWLIMQKIEYGIVRPVASKIGESVSSSMNSMLGRMAANGGRLADFIGKAQLAVGGNEFMAQSGNAFSKIIEGAKITAGPLAHTLGFAMKELLYNATSDLVFDAGKVAVKAIAGEKDPGDEFLQDFGTDLLMDIIMQYGPSSLAQLRTEMDNYKIDIAFEPYRENLQIASSNFDTAEIEYVAIKEQVAGMRKGTKKYDAAVSDMSKKERAYKKAKKEYESIKTAAMDAVKEAMPTFSEDLGSAMAGKIGKIEQNSIIMWLRKHFTDENAALTTVATQAYNKTRDVYLYAAAINKFQSIQAGVKEVQTKMISLDLYAKGTKKAFTDFTNAVDQVAPNVKFNKDQINYLVAKAEYDMHSAYASDDKELSKISEKYLPYIEKIQGEERTQLNNVLDTMKEFLRKVGESYVNSGAATKQQVKDIEEAALGVAYIPLWGKGANTQKVGIFETPLTFRVGKKYNVDAGLFDVEDMANPVKSALGYVHNVVNNIARNEMAAMLKEIAMIDDLGGIELVGAEDTKTISRFQDIISDAITKVVNDRIGYKETLSTPDKYYAGLKRRLSSAGKPSVMSSVDSLADNQRKLQRLVELNNSETDSIKKANRIKRIASLDSKIREDKTKLRLDIDNVVRSAGDYFNKTYEKAGITVDVDDMLTSSKYVDAINGRLSSMSPEETIKLKSDVDKFVSKIAPFLPSESVDSKTLQKTIKVLRIRANNKIKKENPEMSDDTRLKLVNKITADFKAQLSGDYSSVYESDDATPEGYKIHFNNNGKDASFYIKGRLAKEVAAEMNSKNIVDRRKIYSIFKEAANIKRLLTTGIDPTRVLPNLARDTIRNGVMSGGTDYWFFDNSPFGFQKTFIRMAKAAGDSDENIQQALSTLQAVQEISSGATYNEAFSGNRENRVKRLVESSDAKGRNRGTRFVWELGHDKRKLLETPMNWAEGLTRNRAASSAFMRAYFRGGAALDTDTRLKNAYEAGINAGRENTVNFLRRGTFIKEISAFVPYLSQRFSSIESTKIAFLKDPVGVSSRLMMFGAAYMIELTRVLADEETRKHYYNLSEDDRKNNIVLSLGDGDIVTIPLDETLASIIFPWRRGIETLHNVDPEYFYKILFDGFLELFPFDLSGFSEGDSFNFGRGMEKLGAQTLPTIIQAGYSQATGRNMYYGSDVSVSKDDLAEYGIYEPTAGDFTSASKNSRILRGISNFLGIEQWRLQQVIGDFGGNVGQYVVNWLDKIAGAPEDEQGGKEFVNATFKSFTGMDSEQVQYAFNDGIAKLEEEKQKVRGRLNSINAKIEIASGEKLAELQNEYKKVKQEFALKVGNFVDKYINAYEIAGGLTRYQANKIWYLFNFSDDDSSVMGKSPESYYRDEASTQASREATEFGSSILDKYYDQTKNVYLGDDGKWHYYSPYGEQAFFNTIRGKGTEYKVGLMNIIESKDSNLSALKSQVYDAREKAANSKNWDEYDRLGLAFDEKILAKIAPYVESHGAKDVLTNSAVLDYLEEWFFVPTSYMKTKYGKNLSLAHNASKQRAFVRPYIKDLFGVGTGYTENNYVEKPERLVRGE